jgi:alpha-ketoglutarate-dependent taurine dioxygenase
LFGTPSDRDGGALWPIVQRAKIGTFSETSDEAAFHTDAQYHLEPEPYFLLFCVKPAACGGGMNSLLHVNHINALLNQEFSEAERAILHSPVWSWRTPQVFIDAGEQTQLSNEPILMKDSIRWRFDNLDLNGEQQRALATKFHNYLARHPSRTTVSLRAGDVLLCDNRRTLHARTAFSDPHRKLYRTRLR